MFSFLSNKKVQVSLSVLFACFWSLLMLFVLNRLTNIRDYIYALLASIYLAVFFVAIFFKHTIPRLMKVSNVPKIFVASIVLSLLVSFLFAPRFSECYRYNPTPITMTVTGKKHDRSTLPEVWINKILVNREPIDLNKLEVSDDWVMIDGNLVCSGTKPAKLHFDSASKKKLDIVLAVNTWAGIVNFSSPVRVLEIDLYEENLAVGVREYNLDSLINTDISNAYFYRLLFYFLQLLLYFLLCISMFSSKKAIRVKDDH